MTLRLIVGFVVATLMQLVLVVLSEGIGISILNLVVSPAQVLFFFLVGQAFGWAFYYIWRRTAAARALNPGVVGLFYGLVVWAIVMPIAANAGLITPEWTVGSNLIVSSTAFILYGMFVAFTSSTTWQLIARRQ